MKKLEWDRSRIQLSIQNLFGPFGTQNFNRNHVEKFSRNQFNFTRKIHARNFSRVLKGALVEYFHFHCAKSIIFMRMQSKQVLFLSSRFSYENEKKEYI